MANHDTDAFSIREMRPDDAETVAQLIGELGYERTAADVRMWIERSVTVRDRQAAFVACLGRKVIGWVEVSLERRLQSPDFALIGGLVVSKDYRSNGIGRLLWAAGCQTIPAWIARSPDVSGKAQAIANYLK